MPVAAEDTKSLAGASAALGEAPAIAGAPGESSGGASALDPKAIQTSSTDPSPIAVPSGSETPVSNEAHVTLNGATVFVIRTGRGGKGPEERARAASRALANVAARVDPEQIRAVIDGEVATLYAGETPIVLLQPLDAVLDDQPSLEDFADRVTASVKQAVIAEQKRSAIAKTVFSVSLLVFLGLITLFLLRKVRELLERAQDWVEQHPDAFASIRLKSFELLGRGTLRGTVLIALSAAGWLAPLTAAYAYVLIGLSLFERTREYTQKLTGIVVSPLSDLMARLATALPISLVTFLAVIAVALAVRFIGLFFASVARGETYVSWLPRDLAGPSSVLARVAVVVFAIVFGAPVVTGDSEGAWARTGTVALVTIGLAIVPLLSCFVVGVATVFSRGFKVGDYVEFGGCSGLVIGITLMSVHLRSDEGSEVRVPHLLALVRPTQVLGERARIVFELLVPRLHGEDEIGRAVEEAAQEVAVEAMVHVAAIEPGSIGYQVTLSWRGRKKAVEDVRSGFTAAVLRAFTTANVHGFQLRPQATASGPGPDGRG